MMTTTKDHSPWL